MWWSSTILFSRFAQTLSTIIFFFLYMQVFGYYINMSQLGLKVLGIIQMDGFWMIT